MRPQNNAQQQGYDDFFNDYPRDNNAFEYDTQKHHDWIAGWDMAKAEFDAVKNENGDLC